MPHFSIKDEIGFDTPDTAVDAKQVFGVAGVDSVPAFSKKSQMVPDIDDNYVFDVDTTRAILAGFIHNRRVLIQGYHGTGKSSHIEQVCARLNWACMRVNLDSHISRIDFVGQGCDYITRWQANYRFQRRYFTMGITKSRGADF